MESTPKLRQQLLGSSEPTGPACAATTADRIAVTHAAIPVRESSAACIEARTVASARTTSTTGAPATTAIPFLLVARAAGSTTAAVAQPVAAPTATATAATATIYVPATTICWHGSA